MSNYIIYQPGLFNAESKIQKESTPPSMSTVKLVVNAITVTVVFLLVIFIVLAA